MKTYSGRWCCQACKSQYKTLPGINRHLYRVHKGEGFGVYRTGQELQSMRATPSPYDCGGNPLKEYIRGTNRCTA